MGKRRTAYGQYERKAEREKNGKGHKVQGKK